MTTTCLKPKPQGFLKMRPYEGQTAGSTSSRVPDLPETMMTIIAATCSRISDNLKFACNKAATLCGEIEAAPPSADKEPRRAFYSLQDLNGFLEGVHKDALALRERLSSLV